MTASGKSRFLALAATAFILGSAGCPNSDVLRATLAQLAMTVTQDGSGTGRYEIATMNLVQVGLVPDDPDRAALLGRPVALMIDPITLDLTSPSVDIPLNELTPGLYRLEFLLFGAFHLEDTTVPLPPPTKCVENHAVLAHGQTFTVQGFSPAVLINVTSTAKTLTLTMDTAGLVSVLESGFRFCSPSNPGGWIAPPNADFLAVITATVQ